MKEEPLLGLLFLQFVFIFLNAVFACAEIAVITFNDKKLSKLSIAGDKRAIRLSKLIKQPAGFLATIQVGITLVSLLSSAVATENFSAHLAGWLESTNIPAAMVNVLSVAIITILLTYFTVLFGELVPKRLAMKNAEKIALGMSGIIYIISKIFTPAVWLFTVSTDGLFKIFRIDPNRKEEENVEEEIRMILDAGKEKGVVHADEQQMIQNVFEFDDIRVEEIMTHRTQVCLLWLNESDQEWENKIFNTNHTVYPICSDSQDHIIGVLYAKDYFRAKDKNRENILKKSVQRPFFIPESVHANVLFRNMKKTRNHFAVVVDEYGGMSGVISMNDLLEQLVGNLDDDISIIQELPAIERIDQNTWRIQGAAPLDEVASQLEMLFPEEQFNTFGGWVFSVLEAIPEDESTPEFEVEGLKIMITKIKDHRLISALVYKTDQKTKARSIE